MNAGYRGRPKKWPSHFISVFEKDEVVVSPAGSCVCMAKVISTQRTKEGQMKYTPLSFGRHLREVVRL